MENRQPLAVILLVPFLALTAYTLWDVGLIGLFEYQMRSSSGWQVFSDLVIALLLLLTFLIPHARARDVNPWPWVMGTLLTGSIAPLAYLAIHGNRPAANG